MSGTFEDGDPIGGQQNDDPLENSLDQAGVGLPPEEAAPPVYKAMPDSRIPVSSKRGGVWKSRKDTAQKSMQDLVDAWDEAIRYYNMDQQNHRDGTGVGGTRSGGGSTSGNRFLARRLNEMNTSTENVVFANVNAQVPELYAKNPVVSVTTEPSQNQGDQEVGDTMARALQKLINALFSMKYPPGVNIKTKAKKNVVIALLTNMAWFEVGYTQKDKSSEQAVQNLVDLSAQLEQAADAEEIREIEGQLTALEEKVEFLQPSGPYVRIRMPHQVLRDPNSSDPYLSDCNWMMIEDMLPTEYINAIYAEDDDDSDENISIFEPTHVLNSGSSVSGNDEFTLFNSDDNSYNAYGFETQEAFDKACLTKVWYVWDKVTRRLEMYADNDWKWPIWVWDDPYQLQGFYPLTPMWFHDSPTSLYAKGEVSYYLDQQDQINEINDERRRALLWARRNIFYNKNSGLTQETIDQILKGPDATATPIDVPEGVDPQKMVFSITPPSMGFTQLFDKGDLYKIIDRIAATSEVERGGEFKTNTTNKAIDYYSSMGNLRMDMRLDAIEDALGDIGWKLAQLCLRFMDVDTATALIGMDVSEFWRPLDNLRDFARMSLTVVGGSTQKLTTQQKKQEAVQVGQMLSQYVRAAPATALKVSLNMLSKAFDDFMISKEDWDAIDAEVQKMAQSQQGGAPGQPGMPSGAPPPGQPVAGGAPGAPPAGGGMLATIVQAMQQLPPPVLQAIGSALAQGVPPAQIFQQLLASQAHGGAPSGGQAPQGQVA
jgi:hypothetical protein